MPKAVHALSTPAPESAKPSRRTLLGGAAALAAAGTVPAAAATAPHPDAELIRLADLAVEARRLHVASLSAEVFIPDAVVAENERLSALCTDYCLQASDLPAHTAAGKRAKARVVALANSHNLSCDGDPAFITLESLLDDLLGGEGACAAFDHHVHRRDGAL